MAAETPDVVAFLRDFPQTPETICTEAALAWLKQGGLDHSFDAATQRDLYARRGFCGAVATVAAQLGLSVIATDQAAPGEVVICRHEARGAFVGLMSPSGLVAGAAFGRFVMGPMRPLFVLRRNK